MRHAKAGLAYFGLVFAAGFLMGAIRVPFLVPQVGVRVAELIEMPIMFFVILYAARFVVRRFHLPPSVAGRLPAGLIALALLVAAELLLMSATQGMPLAQYVASRDSVSGGVYLAMLGVFAAMPSLLARTVATGFCSRRE